MWDDASLDDASAPRRGSRHAIPTLIKDDIVRLGRYSGIA
jgi:hypothetical protein